MLLLPGSRPLPGVMTRKNDAERWAGSVPRAEPSVLNYLIRLATVIRSGHIVHSVFIQH